jgi:hypothetical protein
MSQGPFGLGRGTLGPAPACAVIVNVAPISVSASATISARLILVFMFILLAFPGSFRHLEFSWFRVRNASKSKLSGTDQYSHNEAYPREQIPKVKDIMFERLLQFTQRLSRQLNLASAMSRYVTFVLSGLSAQSRMALELRYLR